MRSVRNNLVLMGQRWSQCGKVTTRASKAYDKGRKEGSEGRREGRTEGRNIVKDDSKGR